MVRPAALAAAVAATALAGLALAAGEETTLEAAVKPSKPKASAKRPASVSVTVGMHVTRADGEQPTPLTFGAPSYPKGFVLNAKAFATCPFAKLEANRVEECPAKSIIGTGEAAVMARPAFEDPVPADVTVYNVEKSGGKTAVGLYAKARGLPITIPLKGTFKKGPRPYGLTLDVPVPPIQTLPGLPDASIIDFVVTWDKVGKKKTKYFTTTRKCPKGGWKFGLLAKFSDGTSSKSGLKVRC